MEFFMEYKVLSVKGAILNQNQLEQYMQTIAADHNLQNYSRGKYVPNSKAKRKLWNYNTSISSFKRTYQTKNTNSSSRRMDTW